MVRELNLNQILERQLPGHPLEVAHFRLYHDSRTSREASKLIIDGFYRSRAHICVLKARREDCSQFGIVDDHHAWSGSCSSDLSRALMVIVQKFEELAHEQR